MFTIQVIEIQLQLIGAMQIDDWGQVFKTNLVELHGSDVGLVGIVVVFQGLGNVVLFGFILGPQKSLAQKQEDIEQGPKNGLHGEE